MTINQVAFAEIDKIAQEEAAKGWDTRRLIRARQRVGDGVANWLHSVSGSESVRARQRPLGLMDSHPHGQDASDVFAFRLLSLQTILRHQVCLLQLNAVLS